MKYLHTMVRVTDIDASLKFYCDALGLRELRRTEYPKGRFTLVFLAAPGDDDAQVELTWNWDREEYGTGRAFIIPHEEVNGQWQGAVCELPMPAFATGIMRGRFGSDGALYTCGMFAWAGNATSPGGFHRIRRGTQPAQVPPSCWSTPAPWPCGGTGSSTHKPLAGAT